MQTRTQKRPVLYSLATTSTDQAKNLMYKCFSVLHYNKRTLNFRMENIKMKSNIEQVENLQTQLNEINQLLQLLSEQIDGMHALANSEKPLTTEQRNLLAYNVSAYYPSLDALTTTCIRSTGDIADGLQAYIDGVYQGKKGDTHE